MSVFTCGVCNAELGSRNALNIHLFRLHPEAKPFLCTFNDCEASYEANHLLQQHIAEVHEGKSFIQCPNCNKKLRKDSLTLHLRTCKGQRSERYAMHICPFPDCEENFYTSTECNRHYQHFHADLYQKLSFSDILTETWIYKLYFIRNLQRNNFKVGMTCWPLQHRLSGYASSAWNYPHELVNCWALPLHCNNHWSFAHQIENKVHLELARAGFELIGGRKREFFKFKGSPDNDTITICNIITSLNPDLSEPLKLGSVSSPNKLYLVYSKKYELGKIGYTTMPMWKRLNSMNRGNHSVSSGGNYELIDLIHVDSTATVHLIKAWECDIMVRYHNVFGLTKGEHFECPPSDLELAKQVFRYSL
jgi:hypothetical protein